MNNIHKVDIFKDRKKAVSDPDAAATDFLRKIPNLFVLREN